MAKRTRRARRASKPASIVRATEFELVDEQGQTRAHLGALRGAGAEDVGFGLVLLGREGTPELTITVDGSGPGIHLTADGSVRLSLVVLRDEGTVLVAGRDARGVEGLSAAVDGAGRASLHLGPSA
jgi:hypothetical protein